MLKFRCKECDQKIGVPEEWAGRNVRCPRCRHAVPVPNVIDAVVNVAPAVVPKARKAGPVAPKSPLTPMPGLKAKTVAMPHPAVKGRTAVKPSAAPTEAIRIPPTARKKEVEPQSASRREKSPPPEPVTPPEETRDSDTQLPPEPAAPSDTPVETFVADAPPVIPAEPDPVVVSARRINTEPIVTEVPAEKDFSALFSDGAPSGVGHADVA